MFLYGMCSMFFSCNVQNGQASIIKNIFNLNIVSRHGLLFMVRRKRSSFFSDIKLKVLSKITNCQHKFLSCGGKEVLIKAVAQAVPAYAMSVFRIPTSIYDDIQ